ncbi:unnamed protein product [Rotaria sp. Silwood1]|nr:unnamed protein product [Rotaria sp. Silwood1]CAF4956200.1 unnamed protein product [Rotaria sp. Silwood1]
MSRNESRKNFRIILILAIITIIIFGILLILYITRQNLTSKTILIEEEEINEYEKKIFDDSINILWKNLRRFDFNQSNPDHLRPIYIEVLNALHQLSSIYKRDLILFLYTHRLISTDIPFEQRLTLRNANLTNVQFKYINLNYLYLPGVFALNSLFSNCELKASNFQGSIMDKSRFISCSLEKSTFSGASLKQSLFTSDNDLSSIDFTNTDLTDSNINIDGFNNKCIIFNTRLPNGSFFNIDSKGLINDGGAEQQCNTLRSDRWRKESGYTSLTITHRQNNSCIEMTTISENNCYFQANSTSRFIQDIDLNQYSTLIDNNQARYNVSAFLGCSSNNSSNWATVEIRFVNEQKSFENNQIHVIHYGKSWRSLSNNSLIPIGIRTVQIMIGAYITDSSEDFFSCCAIDDVNFNIFYKDGNNSTFS